jgi:hypothetical protein
LTQREFPSRNGKPIGDELLLEDSRKFGGFDGFDVPIGKGQISLWL